jgi:hypothetical protein
MNKNLQVTVLAVCLVVLLAIAYVNPQWFSYVWAEGGGLSWGTPMTINEYMVVNNNQEIEKTHYANVFQKVAGEKMFLAADWEKVLLGDMSLFKGEIENGIPGCKAVYIALTWDNVRKTDWPQPGRTVYFVDGLFIQVLAYNENAGITGLEIIGIIIAFAILAAVIGFFVIGGWVTFNVMNAAAEVGPWATIMIGVGVLCGIGVLLFVVLGGKFGYKSKKRSISVEKGQGLLG